MNKQLILSSPQAINDPYSHLYFEKDMENGGKGEVHFWDEQFQLTFSWFRDKSNETVDSQGFSFYYARWVFNDRDAAMDTDRNNPNKNEKRVLLIGKPFKERGVDLLVVVNIEMEVKTHFQIISSYPTTNSHYEWLYERSVRHHQMADASFQRNVGYMSKQVKRI